MCVRARTRDKGHVAGCYRASATMFWSRPNICRYLQTTLAVNHRVSLCSLLLRLPRWQMDLPYGSCLFFVFFVFFTVLCWFQRPLPSNTHLKSCKINPSPPSQRVWIPVLTLFVEDFVGDKALLYCWSRCYWPFRKWSFMASTAAWQRRLLCGGVDWSCNLGARYWADIYDDLSARTGRISTRNGRNKSVC